MYRTTVWFTYHTAQITKLPKCDFSWSYWGMASYQQQKRKMGRNGTLIWPFLWDRLALRLLVHILTVKMQSGQDGVQQSLITVPTNQQQQKRVQDEVVRSPNGWTEHSSRNSGGDAQMCGKASVSFGEVLCFSSRNWSGYLERCAKHILGQRFINRDWGWSSTTRMHVMDYGSVG